MLENLKNKKVFFIGVGGIGVSSLAKFFKNKGFEIFGSDASKNENVQGLIEKYNLNFHLGHEAKNIQKDLDLIIYSPAISEQNPERKKAKEFEIPQFSYPEFLGKISEKIKTIAVSGTNGKTTTTSMIYEILKDQNIDPLLILGGISKKINSNFSSGKDDLFLVEACEYKKSFLSIKPDILIITNITPDHLDYFKDFNEIKKTFSNFVENIKEGGKLIIPEKSPVFEEIVKKALLQKIEIYTFLDEKKDLKVKSPGEHNRQNGAAAISFSKIFSLDYQKSKKYLEENFSGTKRRMDEIGKTDYGATIFDDYAHNPEGLNFLVETFKNEYPQKKIIIIFSPHLYSRTKKFFNEFVNILKKANFSYIEPIYAAREIKDPTINSEKFCLYSENSFCGSREEIKKNIEEKKYNENYILVTVGAGDIDKLAYELKN